MMCMKTTVVYSENQTKHIHIFCEPNADLLNTEAGDTYNFSNSFLIVLFYSSIRRISGP
jgi:hypothetical protein